MEIKYLECHFKTSWLNYLSCFLPFVPPHSSLHYLYFQTLLPYSFWYLFIQGETVFIQVQSNLYCNMDRPHSAILHYTFQDRSEANTTYSIPTGRFLLAIKEISLCPWKEISWCQFPSWRTLFSNWKVIRIQYPYNIQSSGMKFYPWEVISVISGPVMNYFKILPRVTILV